MGRPTKKGVDYFSHDTQISGKTIFTLEQLFGNDGYAFWFKMLEILGQQEGLYYDCSTTSNWLFLTAKARVSQEKAEEILQCLVDLEAIDKELWLEKRIIWCENFVDRVKEVFTKRQTEIPQKPSFCTRNSSIKNITVAESAQSKVKESKVNKSKIKERDKREKTVVFTLPTLDEIIAYVNERNSCVNPQKFFDFYEAGNWKDSNGKQVKNWKQKLITWENKEKERLASKQVKQTQQESQLVRAAKRLGVSL